MVHVPKPPRLHYRWVILAVTSLAVLMAAGVTAVPAVLIHPLEVEFGWDRAATALAVSINVLLYGLAGPFAGSLMLRFGPRRVISSLVRSRVGQPHGRGASRRSFNEPGSCTRSRQTCSASSGRSSFSSQASEASPH